MEKENLKRWMAHASMDTQSMRVPQIMLMIVTTAGLRKKMIEFARRDSFVCRIADCLMP